MAKDFSEFARMFDWESDKDRYESELRKAFHDVGVDGDHITAMQAAAASMLLANRETLYMIEKYHEWVSE